MRPGARAADAVRVWTVLARLASSEGGDIGRLAGRALSDPLRLSVDEIARLVDAAGRKWRAHPGTVGADATAPDLPGAHRAGGGAMERRA